MPSHHMAPLQRALAELPNIRVRVICAAAISKARFESGWSMPDLGHAEILIVNDDMCLVTKLAKNSEGINLIGGLGGRFNAHILKNLPRKVGDLVGLLLERGIFIGGFKDHLRPMYHRAMLYSYKDKFDFIFAFGTLGAAYYRNLGVPAAKIFPFQYQCNHVQPIDELSVGHPPRLIYVGGFTHRKGADLVPDALRKLQSFDWSLTLVGGGPLEQQMQDSLKRCNLDSRVRWLGEIASDRVVGLIAESDLCIVPSRHDGWGMAVNEAIEAGLCVVASPSVGAKDLITSTGAGTVATDATADAIAAALLPYLETPQMITTSKRSAVRIRDHFRGKAVAEYTVAVLRHISGDSPSPQAPWEKAASEIILV